MTRLQRGFSLIELMIVVAIISILAAVALPTYQDYTVRTKVGEGLAMASGLKLAISETFQSKGPRDMSCTSIADCSNIGAAPTPATASVTAITSSANGTVIITYDTSILGAANTLVLAPWDGSPATPAPIDLSAPPVAGAAPAIIWKCGHQASGSTPTTSVHGKYLPGNCR